MGVQRYDDAERAILVHVGKMIARKRRARKWTQAMLGERVGETFQMVQKWESATTGISVPHLFRVAQALGEPLTAFVPPECALR